MNLGKLINLSESGSTFLYGSNDTYITEMCERKTNIMYGKSLAEYLAHTQYSIQGKHIIYCYCC